MMTVDATVPLSRAVAPATSLASRARGRGVARRALAALVACVLGLGSLVAGMAGPAAAVQIPGFDLDYGFQANVAGLGGFINAVAVQDDGKVLVAGTFPGGLVRLNPDGTVDAAFAANLGTGFDDAVTAMVLLDDGKILVGGPFFS